MVCWKSEKEIGEAKACMKISRFPVMVLPYVHVPKLYPLVLAVESGIVLAFIRSDE